MTYEEALREDLARKQARRDRVGDHVKRLTERSANIKAREKEVEEHWAIFGLFELCYRHYLKKQGENCNSELLSYKIEYDALCTLCEKLEQRIIIIDGKKTEDMISEACAYMFGASVLQEAISAQEASEEASEERASDVECSQQTANEGTTYSREVSVGLLGKCVLEDADSTEYTTETTSSYDSSSWDMDSSWGD